MRDPEMLSAPPQPMSCPPPPKTLPKPGARRIGLLVDSLIGGGAERVVLNLAEGFRSAGHEVHVILVRKQIQHALPEGIHLHALSDNGQVLHNKLCNKLALAWRLRQLVWQIEKESGPVDFFISNAEDSDRLSRLACLHRVFIRYRNSMAEYLDNKLGRTSGIKRLFRIVKWHIRFHATYSGRNIITVSDAMRSDIVDQVGVVPRSIHTIYNPFDFPRIRHQGDAFLPDIENPYLIYAARFSRRKRQDLLLRAYRSSTAYHTHKLVLLGDAYGEAEQHWLTEIHKLIDELGMRERVLLPGFQINPYPWIRHADLFAMSSDSEGLPTVLIEALILGTPVVSTDCPTGPSEILTGRLARYLCPRNDIRTLAMRIDQALLAYPLPEDGALQKFSASHVLAEYIRHCAPQASMK